MLKIGSGAGFSGDRLEPAVELAKKVDLDYLVLECLAERTIAIAQKEKKKDQNKGYDPLLVKRLQALLPVLNEKRFRIVTNMGAANPIAGAKKVLEIAREMDISCKVAVVTGDDVIQELDGDNEILENSQTLKDYQVISANAYLGAEALLPALKTDADIIITGRVADPSLFLAPMIYYYNWSLEDYEKLGQGTVIGHLLECAGQITGGYFADIGEKEVEGLAELGFPYASIDQDGTGIIMKTPQSGGVINLKTVKEQLLYEVHDPSQYLTPDVTADFSNVKLTQLEKNKVMVTGGKGRNKPDFYKVSIGYHAGFIGEGEISYAGSTAVERAKMAEEILRIRLSKSIQDLRVDLIGLSSVHRTNFGNEHPYEVRVRAIALCPSNADAISLGNEVEALYTNGPYGGGGARKRVSECIGVVSTFLERERVDKRVKTEVLTNERETNQTI
ncbi:acyclic terpene utilization AtuA family protein [Metabacillus schmidteae]|uniref:acyclic terpene utilization AtuA family protein n=1 Tax=Metabacillus schmidteae TaxID=2730405 RepID=UPI00158D482F|nr:acyclic terpene utilization AtuA family protein [Metabacillus schmidteae]